MGSDDESVSATNSASAQPKHEFVLDRDASSIRAALATRARDGLPLSAKTGRGAILKFLRLSLRVCSVTPESRKVRRTYKLDSSRSLSQTAAANLIAIAASRPLEGAEGSRHLIDNLERERHRDDSMLGEYQVALETVYFGAAASLVSSQRIRHSKPVASEWVSRCWATLLRVDEDFSVQSFVDEHFQELLSQAPPATTVSPARQERVVEAKPQERSTHAAAAGQDYVLALNSIKSREAVVRRFVSSEKLPTRHAQLLRLGRFVSVSPMRGIKASHCLAVVAGPHGVGKSEFINEWLLSERDRPASRFDDVLYISACSAIPEDALVQHVRDYLSITTGTPLIVLDGLRTRDGEFAWDSDPSRDADPSQQTASLAALLTSLIGHRTFVAILGVQSLSREESGLPRGLSTHPNNPAVAIADLLRLEPLPDDEARIFASVLLEQAARSDLVDAIVHWSNGLPLRLAMAAQTPQALGSFDNDLVGRGIETREFDDGDPRQQMRRLIAYLDRNDGQLCAAMRLVSLFRRPQPAAYIDSVVRQVLDAGQPIGRIPQGSILDIVRRSTMFSWGIEGAVELHDAVRHVVEEDLARAIAVSPQLAQEVRAIHLMAARESFNSMRLRGGSIGDDDGEGLPHAVPTQHDLELACDCAYHLLGTRGLPGRSMAVGSSAYRLSPLARKVFSGEASDEEVDRFCYSTILRRPQLNGNAFSSRGLFALKLGLLRSFMGAWSQEGAQDPSAALLRRTVRFEYAACSIVTGGLRSAERELWLLLRELYSSQGERTAAVFGEAPSHRRDRDMDAADYCEELAKVTSTLASSLLRSGQIAEVVPMLERAYGQVIHPTVAWATGERPKPWNPEFQRELLMKVHRAKGRTLARLGEAVHLGAGVDAIARTEALNRALDIFRQADEEQAAIGSLREALSAVGERPVASYRLGGESARSLIRCLVRRAQLAGRDTSDGTRLMHEARDLVDKRASSNQSSWGNDTIGFLLLSAMLLRLEGRLDAARDRLKSAQRDPKYQNLGACSLAVKLELRLEHAKLALACSADGVMPSETIDDLQALKQHAAETQHRLIQLDALLLQAAASQGAVRQKLMREARLVNGECKGHHARDDVFAWAEHGDTRPWSELSLAV